MERSFRTGAGDLGTVLARVQALEDERAILSTMYRYGHAIDLGHDADWVDCFTEDGEYDILYGPRPPTRLALGRPHPGGVLHRGREQLAAFVAGHSRPPAGIHKHLLIAPRISLDGATAASTSYYIRADWLGGRPRVQSFGQYRDRWRRVGAGEWRIARREVAIESLRPLPAVGEGAPS